LIDAALAQFGITAAIVQEIGHPATLFPMVEAGIGISIMPALALPLPQGSQLCVKRLKPEIKRKIMLVQRKNRSLSGAAQAIWDVVREQARCLTRPGKKTRYSIRCKYRSGCCQKGVNTFWFNSGLGLFFVIFFCASSACLYCSWASCL
jgi:hypothetical protein